MRLPTGMCVVSTVSAAAGGCPCRASRAGFAICVRLSTLLPKQQAHRTAMRRHRCGGCIFADDMTQNGHDSRVPPPVARGGCLLRMQAVREELGRAERRLADWVMSDPQQAVHCTVEQLGERSGASYATVIRFCKRLGYDGFKQFRNSLIEDLAADTDEPSRATGVAIRAGDDPRHISDKIFESSVTLLRQTRDMLDLDALERAVGAIVTAREVYFIGTGTSGLSARYAFTRFFRIGMRCSSETDATLTKQKAAILGSGDVLFAISSSGRSAGVVGAARMARQSGARVISLSDFAISPLSRVADIALSTTPRNVGHFLDKEMPLIVGQIGIIDVLFACCCVKLERRGVVGKTYEATKRAADSEKVGGK
ncbi:MAG: SIS domain-containing protein [Chitinivibrionales bacterium]|nr:SIS domain-containing protein [Chitinivibrionales bacterium]